MPGLPVIRAIPVYNRSDNEIHLLLEPEGDCITFQPSQVCKIVPQPEGNGEAVDLEIEYNDKMISIYLNNVKDVYIDGVKVR